MPGKDKVSLGKKNQVSPEKYATESDSDSSFSDDDDKSKNNKNKRMPKHVTAKVVASAAQGEAEGAAWEAAESTFTPEMIEEMKNKQSKVPWWVDFGLVCYSAVATLSYVIIDFSIPDLQCDVTCITVIIAAVINSMLQIGVARFDFMRRSTGDEVVIEEGCTTCYLDCTMFCNKKCCCCCMYCWNIFERLSEEEKLHFPASVQNDLNRARMSWICVAQDIQAVFYAGLGPPYFYGKPNFGHINAGIAASAMAFRYWVTLKYLRGNRYSNCASRVNVYTYYIFLALIGIILCFVRIGEYDKNCAKIKSQCDDPTNSWREYDCSRFDKECSQYTATTTQE